MILSVERALECSSFPRRPTRVLLRPKSLSGLVGISFEASHFASLTFLRGRKFCSGASLQEVPMSIEGIPRKLLIYFENFDDLNVLITLHLPHSYSSERYG